MLYELDERIREARRSRDAEQRSSRTEREDSETFEDTAFEPRGQSYTRVLLTQVLLGSLAVGALLLCKHVAPKSFQQIQTSYHAVMQTDLSAREVMERITTVWNQLRESIYVIVPYQNKPEQEQANKPEQEIQEYKPEPEQEQELQEHKPDHKPEQEIQEHKPEPKQEMIGETEDMGGEDIAMTFAAKHCILTPVWTTKAPVRPLLRAGTEITSRFGYRKHPITGDEGVHTGMDLSAPEGEPIHAAYFGTVKEAGVSDSLGKYVVLEHAGGLETLYAHCSELLAQEGMRLRAGDVIAKVGSTGQSTGPHLHFELRLHGQRCNPEPLFRGDVRYPLRTPNQAN